MLALLLSTALAANTPLTIEYPIPHYAAQDEVGLSNWSREVRQFRTRMRGTYPKPDVGPVLLSAHRESEFTRATDPARHFYRSPSVMFKQPVLLSWCELIDQHGRLSTIYILSSNQPRERDRAILQSVLLDRRWRPAMIDGTNVPTIQTASINLGDSPFLATSWLKKINEEEMILIALLAIGISIVVVTRRRKAVSRESS